MKELVGIEIHFVNVTVLKHKPQLYQSCLVSIPTTTSPLTREGGVNTFQKLWRMILIFFLWRVSFVGKGQSNFGGRFKIFRDNNYRFYLAILT